MTAAPPQVLVIQLGARRDYELACMLQERHALHSLQTGIAWHVSEGKHFLRSVAARVKPSAVTRRTISCVPQPKLRRTVLPELVGAVLRCLHLVNEDRAYRIEDRLLGLSARLAGVTGVDLVLNSSGNGGATFLRWAKSKGLKIATDVAITPLVLEKLSIEQKAWPGWEPHEDYSARATLLHNFTCEIVAISDLLICPSVSVAQDLLSVCPEASSKIKVIPYGIGTRRGVKGIPHAKSILFAGHATLRKGLPYLADAARQLKDIDPTYDIRVAGKVSDALKSRPECASLNFLGHLSQDQLHEAYLSADVFCLPSLAEGMASVTLEAMACSVPCVVTAATGAPVSNEVNGFIIPERDSGSIVRAIRTICENRSLRSRMSIEAGKRASWHSADRISEELLAALKQLGSHSDL